MKKLYKQVLKQIKKYDTIVVLRHEVPDFDASGSQFGLVTWIKDNFPNKKVYALGKPHKFFSPSLYPVTDSVENLPEKYLLIIVDVANRPRVDGKEYIENADYIIKIDHHPEIDKFSDYQIIDIDASSTCEMIANWCYKCNLNMPRHAAECLFMGIIADTNRFLFGANKPEMYEVVLNLVKKEKVNPNQLYEVLYKRNISEVRLEGFISLNMKITKNGLGYVKITDDDLKKYGVDSASIGSIMNNYNFIQGLNCWVVFTEDLKNNVIRTSARSRGVKINKLFEQYNGGGHIYACGAKLKSFSEADEIIEKLDELCKEYKEDE